MAVIITPRDTGRHTSQGNIQIKRISNLSDYTLLSDFNNISSMLSSEHDRLCSILSTRMNRICVGLSNEIKTLSTGLSSEVDALSVQLSTEIDLIKQNIKGGIVYAGHCTIDIDDEENFNKYFDVTEESGEFSVASKQDISDIISAATNELSDNCVSVRNGYMFAVNVTENLSSEINPIIFPDYKYATHDGVSVSNRDWLIIHTHESQDWIEISCLLPENVEIIDNRDLDVVTPQDMSKTETFIFSCGDSVA